MENSMKAKADANLFKAPKTRKFKSIKIVPYVFIAPAIIYLFIVTIIPAIMALPISFTDWTALTPRMHFIGIENYKRLLHDRAFFQSILVMSKFFIAVPLTMAAGLLIAMLLNNKLKGMTFFRVVYYSPVITSTIAAAILFDWFFQPTYGLFNSILNMLGIPGIGWVSDAKTAAMSVIIFVVWKRAGNSMLIYLAGLQGVPDMYMEAADIDGASWWQKFWYITLPLLKPANIYLFITGIISTFMIFQETYMLQGPLKSTETVVYYIYEKGFTSTEMGYASAMSFVLFVVILIITILQFKVMDVDANSN